MYYVFCDSDNGGTPTNVTPNTSTSKYHTSGSISSFPAAGACWSSIEAARSDTTIAGLTGDDLTFYVRGAADFVRFQITGMSANSVLVEGDATGAVWDASKATVYYNGTGNPAYCANLAAGSINVTLKNIQLHGEQGAAATSPCLGRNTGTGTVTFDGVKGKYLGTATAAVVGILGTNGSGTVIIQNCIIVGTSTSANFSGINMQSGATVRAYNNIERGNNTGGAVHTNCDTSKNNTLIEFGSLGTNHDYCASSTGAGTNAVTVSSWTDQYEDYANFDYRLKSGSSLRSAGIGPSSDANVPTTDIAGNSRSGTTTDIGAAMYAAAGFSITSVTPATFDDGKTGIIIAGSGFGASQGSSTVTIGGQAQTVTAWSATSITITSVRGSNSMGAAQLKVTVI